jgi:hypothetical protein
MGEYINYNGHEIKLGTCESLYYTRLDQLRDLRGVLDKLEGNLEVSEYLNPKNGFRYRFPFPEEDAIAIGDFKEYDKGLVIQLHTDDYSIAEFDHYESWHSCSANHGYNVNVAHPCPQATDIDTFKHSPITWRIVAIKQRIKYGLRITGYYSRVIKKNR